MVHVVVFATLFVCGGVCTVADVQRWADIVNSDVRAKVVVLAAGTCDLNIRGAAIHRVPHGPPSNNVGNVKYRYMHAKFHLWRLPFRRVVYYDLDVCFTPPVTACADMCPPDQPVCAVRDPVATWPIKTKTYFNAGFMVLTPNKSTANGLFALGTDHRRFAEQDTLNEYFHGWYKLPKQCNWLNYLENHPNAKTDDAIHMVHLAGDRI
jgi:hypothetical protein